MLGHSLILGLTAGLPSAGLGHGCCGENRELALRGWSVQLESSAVTDGRLCTFSAFTRSVCRILAVPDNDIANEQQIDNVYRIVWKSHYQDATAGSRHDEIAV